MNEHEAERIAAAMNHLRPDWPVKSLRTLLSKPALADRPRRDVTVALAWVACETATATPARVLEAGPWWRAVATEGHIPPRHPFDITTHCGVCSEDQARCRQLWAGDHEYEPAIHARRRKGSVDISGVIAELKGHVEAIRAPSEQPEPVHTPRGDEARELLHAARMTDPTHHVPAVLGESEQNT